MEEAFIRLYAGNAPLNSDAFGKVGGCAMHNDETQSFFTDETGQPSNAWLNEQALRLFNFFGPAALNPKGGVLGPWADRGTAKAGLCSARGATAA